MHIKQLIRLSSPLIKIFLILAGLVSLLWGAIYNGFPLLYSDSGTYINSGYSGKIPIDRPIFYGYYLRIFIFFKLSLWIPIIVQSLLIYYLIYINCKYIFKFKHVIPITTIVVVILSFTTGLSFFTVQIMPDVMGGFLLLTIPLLLLFELPRVHRYSVGAIVIMTCLVHFLNLINLTIALMIILILMLILRDRKTILTKMIYPVILITIAWIIIPSVYYLREGKFIISESGNIFITGRLVEMKSFSSFLRKECPGLNDPFCDHLDLLPMANYIFIWEHQGPGPLEGCIDTTKDWYNCWRKRNAELKPILSGFFGDFNNLKLVIPEYGAGCLKQLVDFSTGSIIPMTGGSPPYEVIKGRLPHMMPSYEKSKAFSKTIFFPWINTIQKYFVGFSVLFLITGLILFNKDNVNWKPAIGIIFLFVFLNALIASVFSGVSDRYQGRLIWVIPLFAILIFIHLLRKGVYYKSNQ